MRRILSYFILLNLMISLGFANDEFLTYFVKKTDTLSSIIHSLNLKPIYGKTGRLKQVAILNNLKNPNKIHPGQKLLLPIEKDKLIAPIIIPLAETRENQPSNVIPFIPGFNKKRSITLEMSGFNYKSKNKETTGRSSIPTGYNLLTYTENDQYLDVVFVKEFSINYIKTSSSELLKTTNKNLALLGLSLGIELSNNTTNYIPFVHIGDNVYSNNLDTRSYLDSYKELSLGIKAKKIINPDLSAEFMAQIGTSVDLKKTRISQSANISLEKRVFRDFKAIVRGNYSNNSSDETVDQNQSILLGIKYEF